MKEAQRIYKSLEAESILWDMPKSFKTDLTQHDKAVLESANAPKVFGWVLGSCGTHFIDPNMDKSCLESYISYLSKARQSTVENFRFYVFKNRWLQHEPFRVWVERMREFNQTNTR